MNNNIRNDFPYPIAKVYLKTINAEEPIEKFTMIGYLFEITLKYASAISIAQYLKSTQRDETINRILSGINRPSLGKWAEFLRETLKYNLNNNDSLLSGNYFKKSTDHKKMILATNKISEQLNQEKPQTVSTLSPEYFSNTFVSYRNKTKGHGAIQKADCQKINDILFDAVEEYILSFVEFVKYTPVYISKIEIGKGEYYDFTLQKLNGTDIVRSSASTLEKEKSISKGHICLSVKSDNGLLPILSLHPIFIFIEDKEEIYVLNEGESSRMEYLCYHRGGKDAIYSPDELKEDFIEKFGDVIKLDSSKFKGTPQDINQTQKRDDFSYEEKKAIPLKVVLGSSVAFILLAIIIYFVVIKSDTSTDKVTTKTDTVVITRSRRPAQTESQQPATTKIEEKPQQENNRNNERQSGRERVSNIYEVDFDSPPTTRDKPEKYIDYQNLRIEPTLEGSVQLYAYIDDKGRVDKTEIITGINSRIDREASRATMRLIYKPAIKNGKKKKKKIVVSVPFKGSNRK
jgi:large-conductance mechanosensitive channel